MAALEQLDAKHLFQSAHLTADCRLREVKIFGPERNAHAAANRNKSPNQIEVAELT
jgi:hypothetical protein